MNVYDFDKTIYCRDSSVDFVLYLYKKKPSLLRFVPGQLAAFFKHYFLHRLSKTQMKERFYAFFAACDVSAFVEPFWDSHEAGIYEWYRKQHREDDLVISASPRFLLAPICRRLGIRQLIASEVDPKTGAYIGINCHDREKLRRFKEEYPHASVDGFWSDSLSDAPLAGIAREAFLVGHDGERLPWPDHSAQP